MPYYFLRTPQAVVVAAVVVTLVAQQTNPPNSPMCQRSGAVDLDHGVSVVEGINTTRRKLCVNVVTTLRTVAVPSPANTAARGCSALWRTHYTQNAHVQYRDRDAIVYVWPSWKRDGGERELTEGLEHWMEEGTGLQDITGTAWRVEHCHGT